MVLSDHLIDLEPSLKEGRCGMYNILSCTSCYHIAHGSVNYNYIVHVCVNS